VANAAAAGNGHLVLFLHAHLPFVRHPENQDHLEEDWLYEAITETYMPFLAVAEAWVRDGVPARLTMSLTPSLLEMLRDELLLERYARRLRLLLELADREVERTRGDERFSFSAQMYRARFAEILQRFEHAYGRDLVRRFRILQGAGLLEIVTSCATHAFLPCHDRAHASAQIRLGVKAYRRHLQREPPGIWLPECGFVPGLDRLLADEGLRYFLVDAHAVELANPAPVYGAYSPIICPSAVAAFPRDRESSAQVWSREFGYPGDGRYREFYRDAGHDLEAAILGPLCLPTGARRNVGIKYFRVTERRLPLHEKQPYDRGAALAAAEQHATHFVFARRSQIEYWHSMLSRAPVVVAPYDAELFGHWWFEGPEFLDLVVRKAVYDQHAYKLSTPSDVLGSGMDFQVAVPAASSWGAYGYSDTWLNERNGWVWPHVHHVTAEMARIAGERPQPRSALERRALNQLAREAVLASSSDWPFILTMGTTVPYAEQRIRTHVERFNTLLGQVRAGAVVEDSLAQLECSDSIFTDIDYRDFATQHQPSGQETVQPTTTSHGNA